MRFSSRFSRRQFIEALATYPIVTFPVKGWGRDVTKLNQIVLNSGFKNNTSAVLFDLEENYVLESHNENLKLPLASVTKALTAVYSMETIGKNYRFRTDFKSDGKITKDGILDGNLYIIGRGDPTLSIDDLIRFVKILKESGVREISGRLLYYGKWLPELVNIDSTQLPQESFNPGLSGLNLNDNRVLFSWQKSGNEYSSKIESRGSSYNVLVPHISITDTDDIVGSYEYNMSGGEGTESWRVSKKILGKKGVRWLPVRLSARYTGEVLRVLLRDQGIIVPLTKSIKTEPVNSMLLYRHESAELYKLVRRMLDRSTNVAAEIIGLNAAKLWGFNTSDIQSSGDIMTRWFNYVTETQGSIFANHSGLTINSRVSASDFTKFLTRPETIELLSPVLKVRKIYGNKANVISSSGVDVIAKTGTMHFNRGLAGYIRRDGFPKAAFAIFSADIEKKKMIPKHTLANPLGSKAWLSRARRQENSILSRWAENYT